MNIEINNTTFKKINKNRIKMITSSILSKAALPFKDLSIAFVTEPEMKKLNLVYRGKNRITDVLSFDYGNAGEIVICYKQAEKQAKEKKYSTGRELTILLIHAILHLAGYDHEKNEKEAKVMRLQEEAILGYLQKLTGSGKINKTLKFEIDFL